MDFLDVTKGVFRDTRLVYHSVDNKLEIVRLKRDAAIKGTLQHHRWQDLIIRSKWCLNYIGREVNGAIDRGLSKLIAQGIWMASGETMRDIAPVRVRTPISFTAEPCDLCKTLELSFTPDDLELRQSYDWKAQYKLMLQSLTTDAYKMMGAGNYWFKIFEDEVRPTLIGTTPRGYEWSEIIKMWDIGMEHSRRFLDTGKKCFAETERTSYAKFYNVQQSRIVTESINRDHKFTADGSVLKAVGGLYALNTELLCDTCKANVEPDPITIEL